MPLPIPGLNMGVNNLPRVVTVRIVTYRKNTAQISEFTGDIIDTR